jgi:transcriptional regulator with XRE-family HTH domain
MQLTEKVGARITQLRKQKNLSQQKFAYAADMERTYLNHIEKGRKNISVNTLQKVITALGVSFKEFFDDKEFDNNE